MATTLANAPSLEWHGASDGSQPVIRLYPEGTSETFKKGDLVIYSQSENGLVIVPQGTTDKVYGSTGTGDDGVADTLIHLGVALEDASGTAGTLLQVLIPRPNDYFTCALASATDTIVAPDIDNIGNIVDFIKLDSNNNSATAVKESNAGTWAIIVDINHQDTTFRGGTIGATLPTYSAGDRVVVRFSPTALAASGAQA